MFTDKRRVLFLFFLLLTMVACTGESPTPTVQVAPNPTESLILSQATPLPTATLMPTRTATDTVSVPAYWSTPTAPITQNTPADVDFNALAQQMLDLVNQARAAEGLQTLVWDPLAAEAGRRHAVDMVRLGYFSHRNTDGLGPDHRYTLTGGQHAVRENLHAFSYTYPDGSGAPIEDWQEIIANAHENLMNSLGHRENIMAPAHTHLGIGMAYDPENGEFRLAQEFTNQYVRLDQPLPLLGELGQSVPVHGSVPVAGVDNLLLSLAYEPFPEPLTVEQLNQTGVYVSDAESVTVWRLDPPFERAMPLDSEARSGLYHVRIFGDIEGEQALLVDHSIAAHP